MAQATPMSARWNRTVKLEKVQEKVQFITNYTAPTGGGVAVVGALTFNELMAAGGFLIALLSFFINWYYQHKRYKLEEKRHYDEP